MPVKKSNPAPSGLVSPTVAPQTLLAGGVPEALPVMGETEWKQVKDVRDVTSGSLFLPPAILFWLVGSYFSLSAWNYGKAADWIMLAICLAFYYVFISIWIECRRNQYVMFYNDEVMIFQVDSSGSFGTRFDSLQMIYQDRRGYTLILDLGDRLRLLRKHMQPDLQHILDAHQHRLKCAN